MSWDQSHRLPPPALAWRAQLAQDSPDSPMMKGLLSNPRLHVTRSSNEALSLWDAWVLGCLVCYRFSASPKTGPPRRTAAFTAGTVCSVANNKFRTIPGYTCLRVVCGRPAEIHLAKHLVVSSLLFAGSDLYALSYTQKNAFWIPISLCPLTPHLRISWALLPFAIPLACVRFPSKQRRKSQCPRRRARHGSSLHSKPQRRTSIDSATWMCSGKIAEPARLAVWSASNLIL